MDVTDCSTSPISHLSQMKCPHRPILKTPVLSGLEMMARRKPRGQWLHVPRDWPPVPGLEPVLMRDLDPEFIQSELGELLRMAASINDGYGSATFLLERFRFSRSQLTAPSRGYAVGAMVGFGIPVRLCRPAALSAQRQPNIGPRGIRPPTRARHSRGSYSRRSRASTGRKSHDQRRADAPHQCRHCLQHLETASGAGAQPRSRPSGCERRDSGTHRPYCLPTHQLSGNLSLSTGALS